MRLTAALINEISENFPTAFANYSKAFNMAIPQFKTKLEEGAISIKDLQEAMKNVKN